MTHKYEIRDDKNYGSVLIKDGRETFCPFQPPVATQGMGGMGLMRLPCSTNCPHANLKIQKNEVFEVTSNSMVQADSILENVEYVITCGSTEIKHQVFVSIKNPDLKII